MASSLRSSFTLERVSREREWIGFSGWVSAVRLLRDREGVVTDHRLNFALGGAGLYLGGLQMAFANRTPSCERGSLQMGGGICDWRSEDSGSVSTRPREGRYIELLKSALYQLDWSLPTFHCPTLHASFVMFA